jgi:hypothetical protein
MNRQQDYRNGGFQRNTLASILGAALYCSVSGVNTLRASETSEQQRSKSRHGFRLGFKLR